MKQTHFNNGGLKPGSYFLKGEKNKVPNGNLMFNQIIGDFLVNKGLATTEDQCNYVLDCCSDFTLSYDSETNQLCFTVGGVEECVTIDVSAQDVQVNNALTGTGQPGDPVQWGGNLVKNTTVEGNDDYSVTFQNLTQFLTTVHGASANGTLRVSGLASLPAFLRHTNLANDTYMTLDLDFNDTSSFGYQTGSDFIAFRIFPDTQELSLRTLAIQDNTAVNGQVPILTDAVEGKFEWGTISGSAISYDDYEDDTAAGVGGVLVGEVYSVTAGNPYGLADGTLKKRRS